ncbi:MAG: hypothetical protein ACRDIY_08200 [Chloroflexota bacterium]
MDSTWPRFPATIFSLLVALAALVACQPGPATTVPTTGPTTMASPTSLAVVATPSAKPTAPMATAAVVAATTATPLDDSSASVYLDDRSGPAALLRSYDNAINRREYARAYSYWEPGAAASQLPPFGQFQQGYTKTASVTLITGPVTSDPGAGQLNYSVPIALVATTTDGATQTFVGCYQLHLAQPGVQAVSPFQPLGIRHASVQQVANGADTTTLLGQACH